MSYTVTKNGKTFDQLSAEINGLTLRDRYKEVFEVFYFGQSYENLRFQLEDPDFYQAFRAFTQVDGQKVYSSKIPYQDVVSELINQKQGLITDLTSEFDLLQAQKDVGDRVDALTYWFEASEKVGTYPTQVSKKALRDFIVAEGDMTYLSDLEAEHATIVDEKNFESEVQVQRSHMDFGRNLIALISQLNKQNNITVQQTQTIFSNESVQSIIALLENGALETAKAATQALDVTGLEPLDETYKTRIIGKIDEKLGL